MIGKNLTTNELYNWRKYAHMHAKDGVTARCACDGPAPSASAGGAGPKTEGCAYTNPFDRGVVQNVLEFALPGSAGRAEWDRLFTLDDYYGHYRRS